MRKAALILVLALALAPTTGATARKKRKKHHTKRPVATQPAKAPAASQPPEGTETPKGADAGAAATGATGVTASTSTATAATATATTSTATLHEVEAAPVEAPGLVVPPHEGTMPHARPQGHGLSIAAKIGGTYPTSKLGVTYLGALELAYAPPVVRDLLPIGTLTIGVELGYVQPKLSSSATDPAVGDYSYELDQRLFTGDLDATLVVPLRMLKAYGGVGLGVYLLRARIDSFGQVNTESQTRSGLQLRGGASLTMGPGDLFAELRYHYVHLQFLSTGSSNAGGVTLAAGYRYSF